MLADSSYLVTVILCHRLASYLSNFLEKTNQQISVMITSIELVCKSLSGGLKFGKGLSQRILSQNTVLGLGRIVFHPRFLYS